MFTKYPRGIRTRRGSGPHLGSSRLVAGRCAAGGSIKGRDSRLGRRGDETAVPPFTFRREKCDGPLARLGVDLEEIVSLLVLLVLLLLRLIRLVGGDLQGDLQPEILLARAVERLKGA